MGLDTTHGCWNGAYSAFMRWRCAVAKAAGLPPLRLMDGFYEWSEITHEDATKAVDALGFSDGNEWARDMLSAFYCGAGAMPIKWECLKPSPLHILLNHSDCDGEIQAYDCAAIADALEALIPNMPEGEGGGHIGNWRDKTATFVAGLRLAAERGECVQFK